MQGRCFLRLHQIRQDKEGRGALERKGVSKRGAVVRGKKRGRRECVCVWVSGNYFQRRKRIFLLGGLQGFALRYEGNSIFFLSTSTIPPTFPHSGSSCLFKVCETDAFSGYQTSSSSRAVHLCDQASEKSLYTIVELCLPSALLAEPLPAASSSSYFGWFSERNWGGYG